MTDTNKCNPKPTIEFLNQLADIIQHSKKCILCNAKMEACIFTLSQVVQHSEVLEDTSEDM